jgi:hypothetical protein
MLDRLIAIVLTATLALPAIVEPPCCCETLSARCAAGEGSVALAPCCRNASASDRTCGQRPVTCGCDGCLASKPANPLASSAPAPRAGDLDDLPLALGAGPQDPLPCVASAAMLPVIASASIDRPPPDLHAWFCVWVI